MSNIQIIALVAIAIICVVAYSRKNRTYRDITVGAPAQKRKDLYYGYYSCNGNQVAETKGHVNLFHTCQFEGQEKTIQNILDAAVATILDVSVQLFERESPKHKYLLRSDAAQRLRDFFTLLENRGALQYVKYLSPVDEPNNTVVSDQHLNDAVTVMREVARGFSSLQGVRYFCIYAADKPFMCQDRFNVVGFDDYDKKSSVLTGQYAKFRQTLAPHQRTVIIPGGCFGQDPTPFVNFAQTHPEVEIVMPFLWWDANRDSVGNGIRSMDGIREAYIAAGKGVVS